MKGTALLLLLLTTCVLCVLGTSKITINKPFPVGSNKHKLPTGLPESFYERDDVVYDGTRYVYFCAQSVYRIDLANNYTSTLVLSGSACANGYCTSVGVGEGYMFFYTYLGYMQWAIGRANADGTNINSTFVSLKSSVATLKYDPPTSKLYFSCQFGMWSINADGSQLTQISATQNIWTFAVGHTGDGSVDIYYNVDQTGILRVNSKSQKVDTVYGCTHPGYAGCFPRGMSLDYKEENLFFSASNGANPYLQVVNVKTKAYVTGYNSPSTIRGACMMITDPFTNVIYYGGYSGLFLLDADLPNATLTQIVATTSANAPYACGVAVYANPQSPVTVTAVHPTSGAVVGGTTIYVKGSGFGGFYHLLSLR